MDDAVGEGMRRLHSTVETSNNVGRRADDGERGGKGRRKGESQRMPRTQRRNQHVPDGLSPELEPKPRMRLTFGRSPVRKSRTPGSARGAGGNSCPYRDRWGVPAGAFRDATLR